MPAQLICLPMASICRLATLKLSAITFAFFASEDQCTYTFPLLATTSSTISSRRWKVQRADSLDDCSILLCMYAPRSSQVDSIFADHFGRMSSSQVLDVLEVIQTRTDPELAACWNVTNVLTRSRRSSGLWENSSSASSTTSVRSNLAASGESSELSSLRGVRPSVVWICALMVSSQEALFGGGNVSTICRMMEQR